DDERPEGGQPLRPLLGRAGARPPPALRRLLLHGDRVVHRARGRALRARRGRRAEAPARLRRAADLEPPLPLRPAPGARGRAPPRGRAGGGRPLARGAAHALRPEGHARRRRGLTPRRAALGLRRRGTARRGGRMAIEVGRKAPAFTLEDAGGGSVALADYAGRDVILYFYPRDDTPGCTKEACGFRDLWKKIQAQGAVVIGGSPDKPASHRNLASKYKPPFPLLSDPGKKVMTAYGAWGEKTLYGKKTEGVIRSTVWIGPDGRVKKHWKRVAKAEQHPADVLEALSSPQ